MFKRSHKPIEKFSDGTKVYFAPGKFDDWCVYQTLARGKSLAPLDVDYFAFFQTLARKHSRQKVYKDFIEIYESTDTTISKAVLRRIKDIADSYGSDDALEVHKNFVVIYAGMIAEENKEGAILKKKIKRIGFYQAVVLEWDVERAASFSKGKRASELLGYFRQLESGNRPE